MPENIGRPTNASLDDPAVVEMICERLVSGKSIASICQSDDMPAESTIYLRMANDLDFRSAIARAREAQQEAEIDRTVDMADLATVEDHQVVKLRIWARQWRAAKLAPKKYSEKLALTGGSDTDAPLRIISTTMTAKEAADAYRDELG